jgi:hypothetical protein
MEAHMFGERRGSSHAEREADKMFKQVDAAKALTDREKAEKAFHDNRERLKAERLLRQAVKRETDGN